MGEELRPPSAAEEGSAHLLRYRDAPGVVIFWWRGGSWSGHRDAARDARDRGASPATMAGLGWKYSRPAPAEEDGDKWEPSDG
jgi:hypothetical protein